MLTYPPCFYDILRCINNGLRFMQFHSQETVVWVQSTWRRDAGATEFWLSRKSGLPFWSYITHYPSFLPPPPQHFGIFFYRLPPFPKGMPCSPILFYLFYPFCLSNIPPPLLLISASLPLHPSLHFSVTLLFSLSAFSPIRHTVHSRPLSPLYLTHVRACLICFFFSMFLLFFPISPHVYIYLEPSWGCVNIYELNKWLRQNLHWVWLVKRKSHNWWDRWQTMI